MRKEVILGLTAYYIFTVALFVVVKWCETRPEPTAPEIETVRQAAKPAAPVIEEPGVYEYHEIRPPMPDLQEYNPGAGPVIEQPEPMVEQYEGGEHFADGSKLIERPDPYYPGADDEIRIETGKLVELNEEGEK